MNKYRIISLFLIGALIATMTHLFIVIHSQESHENTPSGVVMQNILSRKSVRSFTDAPVSREQLDTLVRAAMAAPTAKDIRPWKFVILDDRKTLDLLADQVPDNKVAVLHEAPAAILVCADTTMTDKQGNPTEKWPLDCSVASENILLMAEAMGLGAVWVSIYPTGKYAKVFTEILNLPEEIHPFNVIPVGHPQGDPQPKDKYNKENIHFNGW